MNEYSDKEDMKRAVNYFAWLEEQAKKIGCPRHPHWPCYCKDIPTPDPKVEVRHVTEGERHYLIITGQKWAVEIRVKAVEQIIKEQQKRMMSE